MAKKTDVRSEKALKQRQEAEKKLVAEVEEDFAARQRELGTVHELCKRQSVLRHKRCGRR